MRPETIKRIGLNLAAHFERQPPTEATLRSWNQALASLPDKAAAWITDRIRTTAEYWPRNLPMEIRRQFGEWLREHPQLRAGKSSQWCGSCDDGWLFVWGHVPAKDTAPGPECRYVFACTCNQGAAAQIPRATKRDLLARGYRLDDTATNQVRYYGASVKPRSSPEPQIEPESIQEMVAGVAAGMAYRGDPK